MLATRRPLRRGGIGQNVDGGTGADDRDPHIVGLDRERWPEIGDLQRRGAGRDCRPADWRPAG